uniref:Uncharacterized protein n=1 Tax=Arion vulgaris TaxID=1028688 RepID=A0A0B6XYA3_9EUPU
MNGHIMQRQGLEYIVTAEKSTTKEIRLQRENILISITTWHGRLSTKELITTLID